MGNGEGNGEWGMVNGEWGIKKFSDSLPPKLAGNGEWGVGNGEWGMGNENGIL